MREICDDFLAEATYLYKAFKTLPDPVWQQETAFMDWTPWDVVAHLHYYDLVGMSSADGPASFRLEYDRLMDEICKGKFNQTIARERFEHLGAPELLDTWRETATKLATRFSGLDPSSRLPWFGPDMSARMFLTARYMEAWSHAQSIFDLAGRSRIYTDSVRHVATIGVKTFGWTFKNRGLEPAGVCPRVELTAPSGAVWTWNEDNSADLVKGGAVDFGLVVTQARNIADTGLAVTGPVAKAWMKVAQCFAGPPVDPPPPGIRGAAQS